MTDPVFHNPIRRSIRVDNNTWRVFKATCHRYKTTPSAVIRHLIQYWLDAKRCIHGTPIHGGIICEQCKVITERNGK